MKCLVPVSVSTNGTSGIFVHNFMGNGLNGLDITGGSGNLPYGFSQMSALYERYKVVASKFQGFDCDAGSNDLTLHLRALPHETTPATPANWYDVAELPGTKVIMLDMNSETTNHKDFRKLKMYSKTRSHYPKVNSKDGDFSALSNANPVLKWYWQLFATVPSGQALATPRTLVASVLLTYYVLWSEPKHDMPVS